MNGPGNSTTEHTPSHSDVRDTPEHHDTGGTSAIEHVPERPAKKNLKRSTRIGLAVMALVMIAQGAAFSGTYLLYSRYYVSSDNAQVDGDKININAPITGTLTDWTVNQGSTVRPHQVLGRVKFIGSGPQAQQIVKADGSGTVAVNNAVNGQYVTAGTTLATAYDFNHLYVTARIEDTDIDSVHPGQLVDISVDAFPHAPITGIVEEIQSGAAGEFNIYPSPDQDPTNPQRVDQYIPVKIELAVTDGLALAPGMNVTVHIHKN
jgi:multidrug resistance efflux pump